MSELSAAETSVLAILTDLEGEDVNLESLAVVLVATTLKFATEEEKRRLAPKGEPMDKNELTPDDARELGRKVAETWLLQRSAIAAFVEGLSDGLTCRAIRSETGETS